jgi:hypothetical protein
VQVRISAAIFSSAAARSSVIFVSLVRLLMVTLWGVFHNIFYKLLRA